MGKRDLEKLRREHKGKFSRTREPLKREPKEGTGLLAETNHKEGTRQVPKSTFKRTAKFKHKSPFFKLVSALALICLVIGLLVLIGNRTNSYRKNPFVRTEPKYSSSNTEVLDWKPRDFIKYKIEEDEDKNITVSDFVRQHGLAKSSDETVIGKKDKILSLIYDLKGGGFAVIQFWDFGSGLHLTSIAYHIYQNKDLTGERLSFLKGMTSDEENGITDLEVIEHLGLPNYYYKAVVKGYYSMSMGYRAEDKTFLLNFVKGKDGQFHLNKLQESK
ncbi:hypothetical protein QM925_04070 [Streptococcus cristatus]|jgi:hypothetical protein|uniref:hypothetical protein n=1 Tax=Streptococcus cristatus TaxID=45634 RepID=UPI0039C16890